MGKAEEKAIKEAAKKAQQEAKEAKQAAKQEEAAKKAEEKAIKDAEKKAQKEAQEAKQAAKQEEAAKKAEDKANKEAEKKAQKEAQEAKKIAKQEEAAKKAEEKAIKEAAKKAQKEAQEAKKAAKHEETAKKNKIVPVSKISDIADGMLVFIEIADTPGRLRIPKDGKVDVKGGWGEWTKFVVKHARDHADGICVALQSQAMDKRHVRLPVGEAFDVKNLKGDGTGVGQPDSVFHISAASDGCFNLQPAGEKDKASSGCAGVVAKMY